jgi:hypothetical protein
VAAPSDLRRYCLLDFGVQLLEHQFVTDIDGVCENLSVGASVALDDNAIQSKYTTIGRFQQFLKVFVPLHHKPNPARSESPNVIPLAPDLGVIDHTNMLKLRNLVEISRS